MRKFVCGVALLASLALMPACADDDLGHCYDCGGFRYVACTDPPCVFQAMTVALESGEQANYESAISESFVFSPTLEDSLDQAFDGANVYADWNKTVEMDVLGLLIGDAQAIDVEFAPSVLINQNTFVRYSVEYELDVVDLATPTDTTHYGGLAEFDMRLEAGNWRLTYWNEIDSVPDRSTWGYLRGILRLRLNTP
jgi:hypothetical protein